MHSIMDRKAAEFWWSLPINGVERKKFIAPKEVAYYEKDHPMDEWKVVTWKDVHAIRTEKIERSIFFKRAIGVTYEKPCIIWVFYVNSFLMGGYYCVVKTLKEEYYLNFRGKGLGTDGKVLREKVMNVFPLLIPVDDLFYDWMREFCKKYSNQSFYKRFKIQGVNFARCVITSSGNLIDIKPQKIK